jgi:hypothetical protein
VELYNLRQIEDNLFIAGGYKEMLSKQNENYCRENKNMKLETGNSPINKAIITVERTKI